MAKKNPNDFLMDLTVDSAAGKRRIKVIVLNETDKAVVYIPLKSITRVDYDRLQKVYEDAELDMLTTLRDHKLDNGRNALVVYKNIIEVYNKQSVVDQPPTSIVASETVSSQPAEEPKPARKRPGPKPKNKPTE